MNGNDLVGNSNRSIAWLALGDSYTIGEGVAAEERWPMQMAATLRENGIDIADPQIVATTGWTTDELISGIADTKLNESYDWVSLLIGVNNQYRNRDVEAFRTDFRQLLDDAMLRVGGNPRRIVVLSIPDWGVTPFAVGRDSAMIAEQIDTYNRVKEEESRRCGAHYVDITD
ncbi:MAG: SGNH/GDSL hydrolase family protein, partial [Planctomycetes bacterium]|nr:SGNH/GDSL hydrolase family protein [Planctomycetota bacterium]